MGCDGDDILMCDMPLGVGKGCVDGWFGGCVGEDEPEEGEEGEEAGECVAVFANINHAD